MRSVIVTLSLAAWAMSEAQAASTLTLSTDGLSVYAATNQVTWLANANLAATNRFGLPVCGSSAIDTKTCVNPSGSMSYQAAVAWVQAMNAANYLGHSNWQLPTAPILDSTCPLIGGQGGSFAFDCASSALGSLYYNALDLTAPNTAVPIPNGTTGPGPSTTFSPIFIGRRQRHPTEPVSRLFPLTADIREAMSHSTTFMCFR